jgi:hypothetical protein
VDGHPTLVRGCGMVEIRHFALFTGDFSLFDRDTGVPRHVDVSTLQRAIDGSLTVGA